MICSDGSIRPREEGVLTLQEAIRKITSFPVQKMGFFHRGLLRSGMKADVVIFDLDRIKDRATGLFPYQDSPKNYPHWYPWWMLHVLINTQLVIVEEEHQEILPGRVLGRERLQ